MKNQLYYRDAKSDKVYSAWLEPSGGNFHVAIEYGRRGGTLARGIKTPDALPRDAAQKVLDRLIAEKKSKGYTEQTDGKPFDGDMGKISEVLQHPSKTIISRAEMQSLADSGGFLIQRKYDGEICKIKIAGATILTEFMRTEISGHFYTPSDRAMFKRWPGGWYAAITVMEFCGENVLNESTVSRAGMLRDVCAPQFTPDIILADVVADVDQCFASGAEGICAHAWDTPFGAMLCCKVEQIYLCKVMAVGGTQSVSICDADTGADRGRVTLNGGACDQVRQGSIIRVAGMGLTHAGKIRQPKKCRNFLVTF